jgi:hypothetical protein
VTPAVSLSVMVPLALSSGADGEQQRDRFVLRQCAQVEPLHLREIERGA